MRPLFNYLASGVAALAVAATPIAASAQAARSNPAATLSVGATRTGSIPASDSQLRGGNSTLINIGIFAAIVVGILVATTTGGDDDDTPDSQ